MANCDMCGYEGNIQEAIIEGTLMQVCDKCSSFGKVVEITKPRRELFTKPSLAREQTPINDIIVENYAHLIKKSREKQKLTQEELANKLQEKTSVIQKLETEQLSPSLKLAKKLENYFGIKLVEPYIPAQPTKRMNLHDKNLTIGDLIDTKKD